MVETVATTQFVSDKNVVMAEKLQTSYVDKLLYDSASDNLSQEIKTFLSKPILLKSGNLTSTDTFSTLNTGTMIFPYDVLTASPMMVSKLDGFYGFRATTVFRLIVNANRFQQGRYILGFVPHGGADGKSNRTATWVDDHLSTLVQRTTVPHVELDLCCDTEAIIKIPFNNTLNFYPLNITSATSYGSWGEIFLYPYVPLTAVAGNLFAGYSVYVHFEDVQLVSAALPQSGRGFSSAVRGKNATEVEQDSSNIGPLSSSLIRVRDASAILAKVPLLSSYAGSVSWFSDILASAAKVYGWRKPVSLAPSNRMTQNYLPYAANNDGPDMSFPLSLSYENSVGLAQGFSGTDIDEMDFGFLNSIPVWMTTVPWATTDLAGATLTTFDVNPMTNQFSTTVNTGTFFHQSPMQLIGNHFRYWRGSLVYKFKFVKTEFHSGRLAISFAPFPHFLPGVTTTLANSPYLHRQIIDIRETNEFTFVIPFVSEVPYKFTGSFGRTGVLSVIVLEPLVAPATVSSTVSIICEKAGGPDLEFCVPIPNGLQYFSGITPQSGNAFTSVPQGSNVCSNQDATLGVSVATSDAHVSALHCVGEKMCSVRSILKLPTALVPSPGLTFQGYINVCPYAISTGTVVAAVNTDPSILNDLYSRFASCYCYSRGGVRLKFVDNASVTASEPALIYLVVTSGTATTRTQMVSTGTGDAAGANLNVQRNNMPVMYYKYGYSGEVQVPQYHLTHSRVNSDCISNPVNAYNTTSSLAPNVFVSKTTVPSTTVSAFVLRSGSDDLNFGNFISVPPMKASSF